VAETGKSDAGGWKRGRVDHDYEDENDDERRSGYGDHARAK